MIGGPFFLQLLALSMLLVFRISPREIVSLGEWSRQLPLNKTIIRADALSFHPPGLPLKEKDYLGLYYQTTTRLPK